MNLRRLPHRFLALLCAISLLASGAPVSAQEAAPAAAPGNRPAAQKAPALCDPGGFGGEIQNWPAYDPTKAPSTEYKAALDGYIRKHEHAIGVEAFKTHASFPATTDPAKPDLSPAMVAARNFHVLSFGGGSAIVEICEGRRQLAKRVELYTLAQQKKAAETGVDVNACSEADKAMTEQYIFAVKAYNFYSAIVKDRLEKGRLGTDGRAIMALEPAFQKYRQEARAPVDAAASKLRATEPARLAALENEYKIHWGSAPVASKGPGAGDIKTYYAGMILQTRQELAVANEKAAFFQKEQAVFDGLKERCKSVVTGVTTGMVEPANPDGDVGENPEKEGVARSRNGEGDQDADVDQVDPGSVTNSQDQLPPAPGYPEAPGYQQGPGTTTTTQEEQPEDTGKPTSGTAGTKVMAGLVAAGVIGGGGYLLYKHNKKKKKKRKAEAAALEAELANAQNSSGASSSTVYVINPVGTAPPGTRFILKNAISGATTGATLEPISLVLVNADGMEQAVSGVAVEASCLTPNPCSLTGAKSVTSVNGHVTFDNLRFNQPDQGVRLQFSASGVPALSMPNSFNVLGDAPRE